MFVNSPSSGSTPWYDTSAAAIGGSYTAEGVSPHAATQRFSYTVPSGRRTMIGVAQSQRQTNGSASSPTWGYISISVTPSGGSAYYASYLQIRNASTAANDGLAAAVGVILQSGGTIIGTTYDGSTGGAASYACLFTGSEFNA